MQLDIRGTTVDVTVSGEKGRGVLLLHGFMCSAQMMSSVQSALSGQMRVAALVVSGLSGLALLLEALMALLLVVRASREKAKKPFVVTERVKRLIAIHAAVNTLLAFILLWISPVLAYLLPAFEPALLMLAAVIAAPLEKHIANQFVKDAQARLDAMPSLIKFGITGSYG